VISSMEPHVDRFIRFLAVEKGLSENYQLSVRRCLEAFADWLRREKKVTDPAAVAVEHFTAYLARRRRDGLAPASQRFHLVALKIFFRHLAARGVIEKDLSERIDAPRLEQNLPETLGEPDVTMQLPEPQVLPATGVFDYKYIEVDPGLTEDAWVRAVAVTPTNLQVMHHALVFMRYPKSHRHLRYDPRGGLSGYFAAYLPGSPPPAYPEQTGQFVPAGATFVFQLHYNATGREEEDQTEMGLYFYDEPPAKELRIRAASNRWFEIPPHSNDYTLRTRYPFAQDVTLVAMSPHMHYRGSHMRFALDRPGAGRRVVPRCSPAR